MKYKVEFKIKDTDDKVLEYEVLDAATGSEIAGLWDSAREDTSDSVGEFPASYASTYMSRAKNGQYTVRRQYRDNGQVYYLEMTVTQKARAYNGYGYTVLVRGDEVLVKHDGQEIKLADKGYANV